MHPELIPGWPLHSYGLMLVIGFYSAYFLSRWTAKKEGVDPVHMIDLLVIGALLGILGARALYLIQYSDRIEGFWDLFAIWKGGLVFHGGLITATVGLILYIRKKKLPVWKVADAAAPAVMLGLAFGRIGCFLNGCCWGAVCDEQYPLAVRFPRFVSTTVAPRGTVRPSSGPGEWRVRASRGDPADLWGKYLKIQSRSDLVAYVTEYPNAYRHMAANVKWWRDTTLPDGRAAEETINGSYALRQHLAQHPDRITPDARWSLPVYPTQLYSSASAFLIAGLLLLWRRHRRRPGEVFALMACLLSVARFFIEGVRNDTLPVAGGLTMGQLTSIVIFAVGLAGLAYCRARPVPLDKSAPAP